MKRFFFLLAGISSVTLAQTVLSLIYRTNKAVFIAQKCKEIGPETMVIFDCDDVLLAREADHITKEKIKPVDRGLISLIQGLQARGVRCLVLTQMPTGKMGQIESLEHWRIKNLKKVGYDFSKSWKDMKDCEFFNLTPRPGRTHRVAEGRHPKFIGGMLVASYGYKGQVLKAFFDEFKRQNPDKPLPKQIIFIDDKLHQIESVQNYALQKGIKFVGIQYMADKNMHKNMNYLDEKYISLPSELGGHTLHLQCMGSAGPTIVFEAGWNQYGTVYWHNIAKEVSKFAKVVVYDRAGYNKSEDGPLPRTGGRIAEELHAALKAASIPGPYILVGHSMGGGIIRMYQYKFPNEVAGMMFLDASHEDGGAGWELHGKMWKKYYKILFDGLDSNFADDEARWKRRKATAMQEEDSFVASSKQMKNAMDEGRNSLRNTPITVIRAGKLNARTEEGKKALEQLTPEEQAEHAKAVKDDNARLSWRQNQLAQLSIILSKLWYQTASICSPRPTQRWW